ncbi:3,4-dihydroxy-2-butanone 4-phosphate synthase [Sphingobacterium spiritivorum]|uniref:3,4-dihydroxy-2-butanone 4-phosphate synthase n=1 Tax=Sphingobacterium spiritivorum TaxID=258 RepID=A0A380BG36_SPHSI|nr:3,4-dihydroxy-2-butanone 4-phosphate synthase [Sphingobacterium spiritivorum]
MVAENSSQFQTPFTISIEAAKGVTTGLSAADRVQTIKAASARNAKPEDLARPGHIFPLRARKGGVLQRNCHTEGSIDLMLLAGLEPQAVLCELMNDDGSMARLPQIIHFGIVHGLTVLSIEDIIFYRSFVCDYTDK